MQDNKLIKTLIPIVAVLIIFESIVLVGNLDKKVQTNNQVIPNGTTPTVTKKIEEPVVDFVFTTDSKEMKVGKSYKVSLNLVGKKDLALDGIETYIKYDPALVTVTGLVSDKSLPVATVSKIDNQNGIIKNIILIDEKTGYKIIKGETSQVLTFNVTPKKEALINFQISSGNDNKEFVTMVVETVTSKALPFLSNILEVNAIK